MKRIVVIAALAVAFPIARASRMTAAAGGPTIERFLSPAYPQELVSAKKADRIAWWAYERGMRNVYTAAAPDFHPVKLTNFNQDNGIDISDVEISDDGSVVTFVHGSAPNREGWIADPTSDPRGADRTIWAVRTAAGSMPVRLGEGTTPALSPNGSMVAFAKDGQIYAYSVAGRAGRAGGAGRAGAETSPALPALPAPLIRAWGTNGNIKWSPDGKRIAFVSNRVDHSFIGVYDVATKKLTFMSPSVDHDTSPTWSPDSRQIAFIRRPGTPFGQQAQQGSGSLGNPNGPAFNPNAAGRGRGGRGGGQGRGGRGDQEDPEDAKRPGLMTSKFAGGYTLSFWVADAATGDAHEFWHDAPGDRDFAGINTIEWAAADHVIFQAEPEEWVRYYSVGVKPASTESMSGGATEKPVALTPGDGMVDPGVDLSADGNWLFYTTNAGDIDRRHIWKAPTAGGPAVQVTKGETIETYPAVLASGKQVAVLSADAKRPQSVGIVAANGGAPKIVFPALKDFPIADEVVPQAIITKAPDGLEIHNQLFLPKDLRPGERRPAIIFVHGGPVREMLLGYHYMHFYHIAYAVNQWLASQGYVVMSVNYRSGIGYGKSFRMAPNVGGRGNAEYQDVLAGGKYLQTRPDVDPNRVGIWGLSYGGVLTSQALARNSDVFKVGVDMAGVHLWGSTLDPEDVSYQSSTISAIDTWKSPVLLVHGDDDRNVQFSQTTGLVQLLRAHHVPFELIVYPDDTHEPLLHKRYLYSFNRASEFLGRYLKPPTAMTTAGSR
ncbi:MAG TPA: prolyl oligopeptidase family serine peptidase [Vicinamibacterales bacterium]|nr:prolyl oligopeptidase family serine peptidase [Vicinamibacterales bacterium]